MQSTTGTASNAKFSSSKSMAKDTTAKGIFMSLEGKMKADLLEASINLLKAAELALTFDDIKGDWSRRYISGR